MGIADCHFKETGMAEKDHSASQSAENHIDLDNPELQNALQIIQYTRRSLFLTGKAGTGKSTFLRYIAAHTKKKHIIPQFGIRIVHKKVGSLTNILYLYR